jgi:Raf kinase inhibitor-like YbhB/YbcL family protein
MRRTRSTGIAAACVLALTGAGCGGPRSGTATRPTGAPAHLRLWSPAFSDGGTIPSRFTCSGEGTAPPLRWSGVPSGTRELAVILEDPDAPGGRFVHWVVLGLSPGVGGIPEGTKPATLRLGKASSGRVGYEPPCPPPGDRPHLYVFTLFALRRPLPASYGASADQVRREMSGAVIGEGRLVARYGR